MTGPIILHLDDEQAALIEAALEFSTVALEARAKRVDPGKVLSQSHQLQAIKLQQVQKQLKVTPMPRYSDMTEPERATFDEVARRLADSQDVREKDAALDALIGHCDACRFKP